MKNYKVLSGPFDCLCKCIYVEYEDGEKEFLTEQEVHLLNSI